jgi:hypothetical protein
VKLIADLKEYARFASGFQRFLHEPCSLAEARAIVERRLAERDASFVRLVERGVFGHPRSPYLPLLKLARCELGDIRDMVRAKGLDATLRVLRDAGVYFTFEEYKGRAPVVRDGQVIPVQAQDFDNPYLHHSYQTESGGTTGAGTRVSTDLDQLAAGAPHMMLAREAHGTLDAPTAFWRPIFPAGSGINNVLRAARIGRIPRRWFSPTTLDEVRPALKYRLRTYGIVALARLLGAPLPWPETVGFEDAIVIARWARQTLDRHGSCFIGAPVSSALRVCVAAHKEGLDLTGATFMIAGEPATPAKVEGITRTGARFFTTYGLEETGRIGMGCARPADCSDVHLLADAFALLPLPRTVPGTDLTVNAFNLTTLLPTTPKLLLNVELDDHGVVESRACGCPLEACGYTEHLREIGSFSKLTGEGVTLLGSEMLHVLEVILPGRFGGSPLDYQLLEEEDEAGFTRLFLVVSPRVLIPDEATVIDVVLEGLRQSGVGADFARAIWTQAGTLRVRRMEPVWTARGKLMPLHLARRAARR